MKKYEFKTIDNIKQVVLNSKKYMCECKNCGASIEKSMYFTGVCSYCGSSDLFAKVLTDNKFYSIKNDVSSGIKKSDFYFSKNLKLKKTLFYIYLSIDILLLLSSINAIFDNISNYNDKDYLIKVLFSGESYSSFELIKGEIMDNIILFAVTIIAFIPITYNRFKKIRYISLAKKYSTIFSSYKTPFIDIEKFTTAKKKKRAIKSINNVIRLRYLKNCTLEMHQDVLKIALAKKIVKDECPSCAGIIVGAVDENYKCKYCGNMIIDVVSKK